MRAHISFYCGRPLAQHFALDPLPVDAASRMRGHDCSHGNCGIGSNLPEPAVA